MSSIRDYIIKIYKILRSVYYFLLMHLTNGDNKIVLKYLSTQNFDLQKIVKTRLLKKTFFIPKSFRSALVIIRTEEEESEIKLIHEKHSNPITYIDIGANIGYWTFARKIILNGNIKFYCFEPSSLNFRYLKKNLKKFKDVEIVKCGLSDQCGTGKLSYPLYQTEKNRYMNLGLLSLYGNTDMYAENVELITLDYYFVNKNVSGDVFLKIDVEGNESKVLEGSINFLSQNLNISVQIELSFKVNNVINNDNIQNSINILINLKYKPFCYKLTQPNSTIKLLSKDKLSDIVNNNKDCELFFRKKKS